MKRSTTWTLLLLVLSTGVASAQRPPNIDPDTLKSGPKVVKAFHDVVAKPSESAVRIRVGGKDVALGVVIDEGGFILTKASELEGEITVHLKDGRALPGKIVGTQEAYDVALLKVDAKGLVPIQWRPAREAKVGQFVASVGPSGDPVAVGIVSVGPRKLKPGDQPPRNSNTNSGFLGVGLEPGEGGAKVNNVQDRSPAKRAGIKVGDIVVEAAGRKVLDQESLINIVQKHRPKDEIELKIKRGDEVLALKATLTRLPPEMAGNPQERFGNALSNRRGGFPTILQHDTVLRPNDCGGALVDLDGRAFGLNIARAGRTETYAVPSEDVIALLPELKSGKNVLPVVETKRPVDPNPNVLLREAGKLAESDPLDPVRKGRRSRVYPVKIAAGEQVTIDLTSSEFDAFLRLEDSQGQQLAEDDDSGGEQNSKLVFRAPREDTYRVIVTSCDVGETGAFALTVRRMTADKK